MYSWSAYLGNRAGSHCGDAAVLRTKVRKRESGPEAKGGLFLLGIDDSVYVGTASLHDYLALKR